MSCNIFWHNLPPNLWEEHYKRVKNPNFLQSSVYTRTQSLLNNQKLRYGLITIDGVEAGICQIQEVGILNNLIHAVILDRGPLWFDGFGSLNHFQKFCQTFAAEFPARFGRKRRFIPEIENSPKISEILREAGFVKVKGSAYQTLILDLTPPLDALRAGLKPQWRGPLSKAERSDLNIEWDDKGEHLSWFLTGYTLDRQKKGYEGPSVKLIRALAREALKRGEIMIGRALKDKAPIGTILLFCHGRGATYQIGWTTQAGRDLHAHNVLLWEAVKRLKNMEFTSLDLGGINDETAKGVKTFKEGLGGRLLTLPGLYS